MIRFGSFVGKNDDGVRCTDEEVASITKIVQDFVKLTKCEM